MEHGVARRIRMSALGGGDAPLTAARAQQLPSKARRPAASTGQQPGFNRNRKPAGGMDYTIDSMKPIVSATRVGLLLPLPPCEAKLRWAGEGAQLRERR